ncbi:PAS domain S-box protein [bacterium]|nr:PAS domain S-box protein [bacterium]
MSVQSPNGKPRKDRTKAAMGNPRTPDRELSLFRELLEIVCKNRLPGETYPLLLAEISSFTGFPICFIELYDEKKQVMTFEAVYGIDSYTGTEAYKIPLDKTLSGEAVRTGKPVVGTRGEGTAWYASNLYKNIDIKTHICFPLLTDNHVTRVLHLAHCETVEYDSRFFEWFRTVAECIGLITDHVKMVERSREDREKLSSFIENSQFGIFRSSLDGRILYANKAITSIFGYSAEEALKITDSGHQLFIAPERRAEIINAIIHNTGKTTFETDFRKKDGTIFTVNLHITPIRDTDGNVLYLEGFVEDIGERKKAERALQESEKKYRLLFSEMINGFALCEIIIGPDGKPCDFRYLDVNPGYERQMGLERGKVVGKTGSELFPNNDPFWLDVYSRVALTGQPMSFERYGKIADKYFEVNAFCPEKGKFAITFTDITERHKVQAALRESEEKYRKLYNGMVVGFSLLDVIPGREDSHDGYIFIEVNPGFERSTGIEAKNVVGRTAGEVFPKAHHEWVEHFKNVLATGMLEHFEIMAESLKRFYDVTAFKMENRLAVTFSDISERKIAEDALRESESRYRILFESAGDVIVIHDYDGRILDINRMAGEKLGYGYDDLISMSVWDLSAEGELRYGGLEEQLISKGYVFYEWECIRQDGKEISFEVNARLIEFRGIKAVLGIARDITQRKLLEKQYVQAQKMEVMARLAGGVAHDFNNVLTAILGYADLAALELSEENPAYDDISEMKKTAERAISLTRQLLAFSRHQMIEPKVINVNTVISNMDSMLRRLIGEDVELLTIPKQNLWAVKIDPGQLEQVLTNLVINARDAMTNGGTVIIETDNILLDGEYANTHAEVVPGEYVQITVSDTGMGMNEEVMSQIFEPFYTTKEKDKGTGLGLSTCYGIVKQNKGHIFVYSEVGLGSTFKVYLPRAEGVPENDGNLSDMHFLPGGKETILIVEDESSVRKMVARILSDLGYTIIEASNGEEALDVAGQHSLEKINLLLTDVVMPQMGGIELSENIRRLNPSMKILFVSGYTGDTMFQRRFFEGDIQFLQKPFSVDKLATKIREILDS